MLLSSGNLDLTSRAGRSTGPMPMASSFHHHCSSIVCLPYIIHVLTTLLGFHIAGIQLFEQKVHHVVANQLVSQLSRDLRPSIPGLASLTRSIDRSMTILNVLCKTFVATTISKVASKLHRGSKWKHPQRVRSSQAAASPQT